MSVRSASCRCNRASCRCEFDSCWCERALLVGARSLQRSDGSSPLTSDGILGVGNWKLGLDRILRTLSVQRTGTWAAWVAARSACADRRAQAATGGGMRGKHRQAPLQILAMTRRALGRVTSPHERLELVSALLARVLEQRHMTILPDNRSEGRHLPQPSPIGRSEVTLIRSSPGSL